MSRGEKSKKTATKNGKIRGRFRESNPGLPHPKREFYHLTKAPIVLFKFVDIYIHKHQLGSLSLDRDPTTLSFSASLVHSKWTQFVHEKLVVRRFRFREGYHALRSYSLRPQPPQHMLKLGVVWMRDRLRKPTQIGVAKITRN